MKRTTDLMNELNQTPHIDQYLKNNEEYIIDLTLSNYLCDRLEKKSLSKADVIKKADINDTVTKFYPAKEHRPVTSSYACVSVLNSHLMILTRLWRLPGFHLFSQKSRETASSYLEYRTTILYGRLTNLYMHIS